jgi:hypothetical protein
MLNTLYFAMSFKNANYSCDMAILFFFFFDMSAQEGEGGFELVTSASLGVVPAD